MNSIKYQVFNLCNDAFTRKQRIKNALLEIKHIYNSELDNKLNLIHKSWINDFIAKEPLYIQQILQNAISTSPVVNKNDKPIKLLKLILHTKFNLLKYQNDVINLPQIEFNKFIYKIGIKELVCIFNEIGIKSTAQLIANFIPEEQDKLIEEIRYIAPYRKVNQSNINYFTKSLDFLDQGNCSYIKLIQWAAYTFLGKIYFREKDLFIAFCYKISCNLNKKLMDYFAFDNILEIDVDIQKLVLAELKSIYSQPNVSLT